MMIKQFSPNMLKTFELCPKKFYLRYIKNISMPVNDEIFEFGKNIHALASYYLKKENIDKMEASLSAKELEVWNYLKQIEYFSHEVINTEYSLTFKLGDFYFGGRLDALVKNGDEYFILDYKTGGAPKNAQNDFQTIIYILAVKEFFKTDKITFVYLDLKNKSEVKIKYTPDYEEKYITRLRNVTNKISQIDFEPEKKSECNCEYSSICF